MDNIDEFSLKEQDIDLYLKCGICLKTYEKPLLLRCMHTFCECCIRQQLLNSNSNIVTCPTCDFSTMIGDKSTLLWKNYIVEKKVEKKNLSKKESTKVMYCTECERDKATSFCIDCTLKLCEDCAFHHKKCVRYDNHKIENIQDVSQENLVETKVLICTRHEQRLRYFCEACQVLTCCDCKLSKIHRNHPFTLMDEIIDEKREQLKNLIEEAKRRTSKYEPYLKRVTEFVSSSQDDRKNSIKEVTETFDSLIAILQSEKENLCRWIDETFLSSRQSLKSAEDELKIVFRTADYLEELMTYPKHEISDVVLEGIKVLQENIKNMEEVTDFSSNQLHGNVFHIDACSRVVKQGSYLDMIKIAMRQISFLQQTNIPKRLSQSSQYTPQTFMKRKGYSQYELCPYTHAHGCTYLPDNQYFLPRNVYLPHAFAFQEIHFKK